jgi:hypothetical protein
MTQKTTGLICFVAEALNHGCGLGLTVDSSGCIIIIIIIIIIISART